MHYKTMSAQIGFPLYSNSLARLKNVDLRGCDLPLFMSVTISFSTMGLYHNQLWQYSFSIDFISSINLYTWLLTFLYFTFLVGMIPNGGFELPPKPKDLKDTILVGRNSLQNRWTKCFLEYITYGHHQNDMLVVVPEGGHVVRLEMRHPSTRVSRSQLLTYTIFIEHIKGLKIKIVALNLNRCYNRFIDKLWLME